MTLREAYNALQRRKKAAAGADPEGEPVVTDGTVDMIRRLYSGLDVDIDEVLQGCAHNVRERIAQIELYHADEPDLPEEKVLEDVLADLWLETLAVGILWRDSRGDDR